MILTGRPVEAAEAHRIGLADRIVADGEALGAAIELAKQIAAFPQTCMNSDRLSAYRQWDFDIEDALAHEAHAGVTPLRAGAAEGAKRFTEGAGRGGSFAPSKRIYGYGGKHRSEERRVGKAGGSTGRDRE